MVAKLFLIPTTLSTAIEHSTLTINELKQIQHLTHFIVETPKIARQHLKTLNLTTSLQNLNIRELNKHNQNLSELINPLFNGFDVGLISDCGMPAIADPGSKIVKLCHQNQFKVVPFHGPNSIVMALMASGFNGQSFSFNGYLPIDNQERIKRIKELNELVIKNNQSQIFIETPFRNSQLLNTLINNCSNKLSLSLAIDLMTPNEQIISKSILAWKELSILPEIHKHEVVFVIGQ